MIAAIIYALPFLLKGFVTSLEVSAIVVSISLIIGTFMGLGVVYGPTPIRLICRLFSDFVRGIPILVLLFIVFYGLPIIGLNLSPFLAAIFALSVFKTAQVIENVRGAIGSISRGQMDAAKAIGLNFPARLLYVIAPQAMRRFLPPWINGVTDAVKGSALVSLLGVNDLMNSIQQVIGRPYDPLPLYILGAAIYFLINYGLSSLSRSLERRFAYIRE